MKNLESLTSTEMEMLLKFPAFISLLAANWNGELNKTKEKKPFITPTSKLFHPILCFQIFMRKLTKFLKRTLRN